MENNNIPIKNILIPLDVLLNIDLGILKVVQNELNNKNIIDDSIFYNSDNRIIYHILNRQNPNVLSLVIKDHTKYNINNLFNEIYEDYNSKILELSQFTDILNMIITGSGLNSFNIDILCKNEYEKHHILNRLSFLKCSFNVIIQDSIELCNFEKYDTIFINNIISIKNILNKFIGKNLYIIKARYNLEEVDDGYKLPNFITDIIPEFMISIISSYNMDETFFIDG